MPPYFLFPGKRIPVTYNPLEGGVEGSVFSMTESGYMDTSTFYMWFANHFIPNLPPARPVVLLVDGHDSHLNLELFQLAEKNGIYLYSLLQNATHFVQPADVGLFGPMKKSWYKAVRLFAQRKPNTDINKKNFCSVFKATWEEVMSPSVLVSAFRKSGIYPLDRKQISNCSEQSSSETGSPQPTLSSKNISGAVQAFEALEAVLTTPSKTKYRRRMAEGYDLEGSPTFSVWQKLYRATEDPVIPSEANLQGTTAACTTTATPSTSTASIARAPLNTTASLTSAAPLTSEKRRAGTEPASCQSHSTERVLREILTFPTLDASGPPKCNVKRSIPNFVSGPESMQILLDEKLKKARQLAEKQKKLQERENKKEERRKKQEEEKLNKEKRKKERADRKKKDHGTSGSKRARKSDSQSQASRGKKWRQNLVENEENLCSICLLEYLSTDGENNPWVLCDGCNFWMHINRLPLGVDISSIHSNEDFFCHVCSG